MVRGWMVGAAFLGTTLYVLAEELILTTDDPSPRGVYKELRVTSDTELAYETTLTPTPLVWIGMEAPSGVMPSISAGALQQPIANASRLNVSGGIRAGNAAYLDFQGSDVNYFVRDTRFRETSAVEGILRAIDGAPSASGRRIQPGG